MERPRLNLKRAIVPVLTATSIGLGIGAGEVDAQNTNPPIREDQTQLQPIDIKTITMQPGEIYKLPRYSIVMTTGEIVVNGKIRSSSGGLDQFIKNKKAILFSLSQKEAVVSTSDGGKTQIDIAPENFQTVVATDIVQMDKVTNNSLRILDQKGWSMGRKALTTGSIIAISMGLSAFITGAYGELKEWMNKRKQKASISRPQKV